MKSKRREAGLHPAIWTFILLASVGALIVLTVGAFNRDFRSYARVTLTSDRAGLVMEPGAKVKLRGVQVGRVASIQSGDPVRLQLELYPEQLNYIPANVSAEITAPTAFGAKYVDLLTPAHPSPKRLAAGAVVKSRNVTVEVNTVFQNLVAVLNQVDSAKLNAVLTALADGFRGNGEAIGEATTGPQPGPAGYQSAQRDDPCRLPRPSRVQRHLQRCRSQHPDSAGRRQHDQRHCHR